ncbi:KTSC domain-containing protein [Kingella negevensis]|uniref:KTSC domain-containing protein n=1 Tax=Kingella negevensis TaxID=1522312 RepID=UPI00254B9AD3|nr:KTSC domain-containing protein [Kingella negevensis]MDK4689668.1 KTSC domain-containing protein [Kingella negevensis]
MFWHSVVSSNLRSVAYEDGCLYIQFHHEGTYCYIGVHETVFQALLNAPSKGKYFVRHIKHCYPYTRL